MFRSRGTKGRGVGMARGRATVNRARGSRGERRLGVVRSKTFYSIAKD